MLSELFSKLDDAVVDMNMKLGKFQDSQAETDALYKDYLEARKIADGYRKDVQTQLGSIIPAAPEGRTRVT